MRLPVKGIVVATVAACFSVQSQPSGAQDFLERWSIVPKANAEPAPAQRIEEPQNSPPQSPAIGQSVPSNNRPGSSSVNRVFSGKASFYSYTRGRTASGIPYNRDGMTAAHRTLPFGTRVRVTDIASSRSVIVRIVDRGPWYRDRVLDLSLGAARNLGIIDRGVANVRVEVL